MKTPLVIEIKVGFKSILHFDVLEYDCKYTFSSLTVIPNSLGGKMSVGFPFHP